MRAVLTTLILIWSAGAAAQSRGHDTEPTLERARALYADARFDEALEVLDSPPPDVIEEERPHWAELRAVVLFALRSERYGDALMDLAMLAPDHELSTGLPPEIYTAFELARAHLRDPVETNLARARALYFVADFAGSLDVLEDMYEAALTAEQRVERAVLGALALFALQRRGACRSRLGDLASMAPSYRFDRRVPPEFRSLWNDVRRETEPRQG